MGAPSLDPQPAQALQDGKSPGARLACSRGEGTWVKAPTTRAGAAAGVLGERMVLTAHRSLERSGISNCSARMFLRDK